MTFQQKCTNFRDFYLVKKGPKNLGIGKPPPPPPTFGQCPKVSDFFQRMSSLRKHSLWHADMGTGVGGRYYCEACSHVSASRHGHVGRCGGVLLIGTPRTAPPLSKTNRDTSNRSTCVTDSYHGTPPLWSRNAQIKTTTDGNVFINIFLNNVLVM